MKRKWWVFIVIFSIVFGYLLIVGKEEMIMAKTNYIQLPKPVTAGKVSLEETILKRRSQRNFTKRDLSPQALGQLLWAAQGITAQKSGFSFRAAPSAGAAYPMEIYAVNKDGLFHYLPEGHRLEVLAGKDLRSALCDAGRGQAAISQAALDVVICAVYPRITAKYGQRGIIYAHIEAGHIAQNIHLQAVALGLGSVPIGAFSDEQIKNALSLPADNEPLYIIAVGYPD
jgi:SagB-type dehydrogenase family enzyme